MNKKPRTGEWKTNHSKIMKKKTPWNKGLTKECDNRVKKNSESLKGKPSGMLNKQHSQKSRKLMSENGKGKKRGPQSELHKENIRKATKGKNTWSKGRKIHTKNTKERYRNEMLNGKAAWLNHFIKNPSKPQVEIWKRTCKICPYVYLNYPVTHLENTYSIDIAIPKLEIAIEFDGSFWHQDKEKDVKRQKELEEDGWEFIRYKDKTPTLDKVKRDIQKLLK